LFLSAGGSSAWREGTIYQDRKNRQTAMTTIHDVAKRAGVAPITVSRVINNSGYFTEETRERVEQAIAELGYLPNSLARSLRSRRTHTLALIITDITNPFFTTLARGVEDTASAAGYTVIFCNTDESEKKEARYLQVLLQRQVDGFLLVPAQSKPGPIEMLKRRKVPVVALDRRVPGVDVDTVRCDSEQGAYELTQLIISLGHRQIGIISGPFGVSTADDRVAGFTRAMQEAGLAIDNDCVLRGEFSQPSGYEMMRKIISLPLRPTAVLAANNFLTIGAMKAIQETGLDVPDDIALAGFDDLPPSLVAFPFFTVAAQPAYAMGAKATELLLNRLDGPKVEGYQEILLPIQVNVRRSSGGPII
jgi:LacI family transcriptional regulator